MDVDTIYPPGADMHTYEPSQRDMINIAKSDLFVYSSDHLNPVAAKITKSMNNNDMKLAVANSLNKQILLNEDDDAMNMDIIMKQHHMILMFGLIQY